MSTANGFEQRKSWRQKKRSGNNRILGRVILTLTLVTIVGLLLWFVFWPGTSRRLRVVLLDVGSQDSRIIAPQMYGKEARERLLEVLPNATSINQGVVARVTESLQSELSLLMDERHDTIAVIVRGYLMMAAEQLPAIAVSDLKPGTADESELGVDNGLLPTAAVFDALLQQVPGGFRGTMLVVFDIEPLSALPRLEQYGDQVFAALEREVEQLQSEHADQLYVLVTRGPLQNVGWDPTAGQRLPISTQTLANGLAGEANLDGDDSIDLKELCRFMAGRYDRLDAANPPQIMLLQGASGRIDNTGDVAEGIWVARANPPASDGESESEDEASSPSEDAPDEEEAESVARSTPTVEVTPVALRAAQDSQDDDGAAAANASSEAAEAGESAAEDSGAQDSAGRSTSEPGEADPSTDPSAVVEVSEDQASEDDDSGEPSFWDLVDEIESSDSLLPHPVAVAPHLWRTVIQSAVHREISSGMDPAASDNLARSLKTLLAALQSDRQSEIQTGNEYVDRMFKLSRIAKNARQRTDAQVDSADALQLTIAIAQTQIWRLIMFEEQAIASDTELTAYVDVNLIRREVASATELLALQPADGEAANTKRMAETRTALSRVLRNSKRLVATDFDDLVQELKRGKNKGHAWRQIRDAHVWLRSPLPDATQRQQILQLLTECKIETVDRETLERGGSLALAAPLSASNSRVKGIQARAEQTQTDAFASQLVPELSDTDFEVAFSAALHLPPADSRVGEVDHAILNQVRALPVKANPTISLLASDREPFERQIRLPTLEADHITIRIDPDSQTDTELELTYRVDFPRATNPPLQIAWFGPSTRRIGGAMSKLKIPAGRTGEARLDLRALRNTYQGKNSVPVNLVLSASSADPDVRKALDQSIQIDVGLPIRDEIRVAVLCDGLTEADRFVSSDDGLVKVQTYAGRDTKFSIQLFNDANRACKAKVWLVGLTSPFIDDGIDEFWPDLLESRVADLRNQVVDARSGKLRRGVERNQLIRGPIEVELGSGRTRSTLSWAPPPGAESTDAAGASDNAESESFDVSAGIAVVARILNEDGSEVPGDQVICLLPMPWPPSDYIDVRPTFTDDEVQVRAVLRNEIDGDNRPDTVTPHVKQPVTIDWPMDNQWLGYKAARATPSEPKQLRITQTPNRAPMRLRVPPRDETVIRLDVDGWPGAMAYIISHRRGEYSKTDLSDEDVFRFRSVSVDYPGKDAESKSIFDPEEDEEVAFPGRASSLTLLVDTELLKSAFRESRSKAPPEVIIKEDDEIVMRCWTDREIRTVMKDVEDDGEFTLRTDVSYLSFSSTQVNEDDQRRLYSLELIVDGDLVREFQIPVLLDKRAPRITDVSKARNTELIEGTTVEFEVRYRDPGSAASGIATFAAGLDEGDGALTAKPQPTQGGVGKTKIKLPPAGKAFILAQVWDQVGNASEVESFPITVLPKPVEKVPDTGAGPKKSARKYNLRVTVDTRSTMRGELRFKSPAPKDVRPSSSVTVRGSRPKANFQGVPEGEYTLEFSGTINGRTTPLVWEGVAVPPESHVLKLGDAKPPEKPPN